MKSTVDLTSLRGSAPTRSPTVRVLSAYSGHTVCNLASLGFAAGVDFDRLLTGTAYAPTFGQSPFAFMRGTLFEQIARRDGYAAVLSLLRERMNFSVDDAKIVNLRNLYQPNKQGLLLRANDTRSLLSQIVGRDQDAPNLIDGAVLRLQINGREAFFEADALAARFDGPIHAGELKSFPIVDGRADPDKLASALDQVAIYIYLTSMLVDSLGADVDEFVSEQAMLIAPKNVGLTPTLSVQDVTRRVRRTERLLAQVPDVDELAKEVPSDINFGAIADESADSGKRLEVAHKIADVVGTTYEPSCFSTCGMARLCRERAQKAGHTCLIGTQAVRLLPGIRSLPRAAELSEGAPPTPNEAPASEQLARAGRLYDSVVGRKRRKSA